MLKPYRTVQDVLSSPWAQVQRVKRSPQQTDRVLRSTKLEDSIYRDLRMEDTGMDEIENSAGEKLRSFPALSRDIFQSFYSLMPRRNADDDLSTAARKINMPILEHITQSEDYPTLKEVCEGRELPAYEAATEFVARASGELEDLLTQLGGKPGAIRVRVPVTEGGETNIYLAYCRDNKRTAEILSRELVKETMNRQTNQYEKLANISYDKVDGVFRCDNMVMDDAVDVRECCRKAEELFELYQSCANRKQIETICTNFLRGIEATKLSITGHMYFVPRTYMERVDIFEDFITLLSGLNKKQTPLVVNSFYIIDDAKQRDKMTEEFYLAVKKEIATYQEKCDYLIKSGSQSPAVMDRWVLKVQALEQKKRHYEGVLQRELDGLDDEFSVLKFLSQELQVRANSIRSQRFPTKKAA